MASFIKILVSLLLSISSISGLKSVKIYNGTNSERSEFPFMVSLQMNNNHLCGATILNKKFILSAAHCVNFATNRSTNLTAVFCDGNLASQNGLKIPIKTCKNHENYSELEHINDISILELEREIPANYYFIPVKLTPQNSQITQDQDGVLIGWGLDINYERPNMLQKISVIVYDDQSCAKSHYEMFNTDLNLCAGWPQNGRGSCQGDSGGPLLVDNIQVGIIAFGISGNCGISDRENPKILTRVQRYLSWIEENSNFIEEEEVEEGRSEEESEINENSAAFHNYGKIWVLFTVIRMYFLNLCYI